MIDLPPQPTYRQTIEAVSSCGIPAANIRIAYEALLQSHVVEISDAGEATDETWLCLLAAIHPFYHLELKSPDQALAYRSVADRELHKKAEADARAWLTTRNMLEKVPVYSPDRGISAFAREVEGACSLEPGSALAAAGEKLLTIRREFVQMVLEGPVNDRMTCLTHVIAASNAQEQDIRFGFVGNEAAPRAGNDE